MVLLGRWHRVRQLLSTPWTLAPLALAYAVLLADSWAPDTLRTMMPGSLQAGLSGGFNPQFMPQLGSIMQLLGRPVVAASAWLHLLVINFVAGRFIFWQGVFQGVPTLHSLLVTCVFAPAGLLLHLLTKVSPRRRAGRQRGVRGLPD